MDTLRIEIHIDTHKKLTEGQKQKVLDSIRMKVGEYIADPHDFVDVAGFRVFKLFTDEELADALTKRNLE